MMRIRPAFRFLAALLLICSCCRPVFGNDKPRLLGIIRADTTHVLFGSDLIPLKDQNGDGINELIIDNGLGCNYLYRGGEPFDTVPFLRFDSTNTYGGTGDVNRDGWDDLVLWGRSSFGWKPGVYFGGPLLDTIRDFNLGANSSPPSLYPMIARDLDRDGTSELLMVTANFTEVQIFKTGTVQDTLPYLILRQHELPVQWAGSFGYQIALGDYNGDGQQDLAVSQIPHFSRPNRGRVHLYFGGPDFDTLPDLTIYRRGPYDTVYMNGNDFGTVMTCPGDLNGDGYDDLFVGDGGIDDTAWFYFGGLVMDTIPDLIMTFQPTCAAPGGDINRDGYDDLIIGHATPSSGEGFVLVYYGGPAMDAQWDIGLFIGQDPEYHIYWGKDVAGLGDFNGDGVDDFAFTTYDGDTRGHVYIYSGTGQPNGVLDPRRDNTSDTANLDNFPNPFNATTRIRFALPHAASVTLAIYDLLGRKLVTLEDRTLTSGPHEYDWNGADATGRPVASGTYLCRLRFGEREVTRKIVLIK